MLHRRNDYCKLVGPDVTGGLGVRIKLLERRAMGMC